MADPVPEEQSSAELLPEGHVAFIAGEMDRQVELWRHYDGRVTSTLRLYATVVAGSAAIFGLQLGKDASGTEVLRVLGLAGAIGWVAGILIVLRLKATQLLKLRCIKTISDLRNLLARRESPLGLVLSEAMPLRVGSQQSLYGLIWAASSLMAGVGGAAALTLLAPNTSSQFTWLAGFACAVLSLAIAVSVSKRMVTAFNYLKVGVD